MNKGLSIIETIIAIAIFSLMIGATTAFVVLAWRAVDFSREQSLAIDEARKGVQVLVKEIREARSGEDGSYLLEKAGDQELIFYSDIDNDGQTEMIRYFLGGLSSGKLTKDCFSLIRGGSCQVSFDNFLQGALISAQVKTSLEGDLGATNEYVEVFADSRKLDNLCQQSGQCSDCLGAWQGDATFDVTPEAVDGLVQFLADASNQVDPICQWQNPNHSFKANFEFSFSQEVLGQSFQLRRGVVQPAGDPPDYPPDQEGVTTLSFFVRNGPTQPVFEYFDNQNQKIVSQDQRLKDSKMIKIFLIVNANPQRPPQDFQLETYVRPRNI